MLNNKRVLCIGNNTSETDKLTTQHALVNSSINYGLVTSILQNFETVGFYHSSLGDFENVTNFLKLIKLFDHVIFFQQPKETYDEITTYQLTIHAINLAESRLDIIVDRVEI